MIALARHDAALLNDLWQQAAEIRREWLAIGLCTEPADRALAEESIAQIYARHHRPRPEFVWVDSPYAALPHLRGLPTHETLRSWLTGRRPSGAPPLASDIAAGLSRLRSTLDDGYTEPLRERPPMKRPKKGDPWPVLPPDRALAEGVPFQEILRQGIRDSLFRSLAVGIYLPIRAALAADRTSIPPSSSSPSVSLSLSSSSSRSPASPHSHPVESIPVGWYGNQDASWVAHFDVMRRLGLARSAEGRDFDGWLDLTRSCGWWWPAEDRCVLVERPALIRSEPVPTGRHDEIRLQRDGVKPAVEYRDGWTSQPIGTPAHPANR